jgi:subtilase family serine protease
MDVHKTCTATFSLTLPPDLTMAALTAPAVGGAGFPITVTDTTQNAIGGAAPATRTTFYLSTNATVGPEDIVLGSRAVPALASGAGSLGTTTLTIPAGTAAGKYFLVARADAGAVAVESKETNNTRSKAISIGPDLVITTLSAPISATAGATLTLQVTTQNAGGGPAGASTTRVYLSADAVLDAGDTLLASRAVPALARNTSNTASIMVTILPGTPSGMRFLIAIADDGKAVMETKETNNVKSRSITILP